MVRDWVSRCLVGYAVTVTAVLLFARVAHGTAAVQEFDQITVHRINVVEPDGTTRLVISNHAAFPGVIVKGQEGASTARLADRTPAGLWWRTGMMAPPSSR